MVAPRDIKKKTPRRLARPLVLFISFCFIIAVFSFMGSLGLVLGGFLGIVQDAKIWNLNDFKAEFDSWSQNSYAYFRPLNDVEPGSSIGELINPEHREMIFDIEGVPRNIQLAILSTEDRNFYTHSGFVFSSIVRAALQNLSLFLQNSYGLKLPISGLAGTSGGSTVTQQVVKNTILKNRKRTITRKLLEIILSNRLENYYEKHEIMLLYCNSVYLGKSLGGKHIQGFKAGAKDIFGLDIEKLPIAAAAYLVGMVQSPNDYNPLFAHHKLERGIKRMHQVLSSMLSNRAITEKQYLEALEFDIEEAIIKVPPVSSFQKYPFIIDAVQSEAMRILGELPEMKKMTRKERYSMVTRGGLKIYTTIDAEIYDSSNRIAQDFPYNKYSMKNKIIKEKLSAVLIDNKTGGILSFANSNYYKEDQQNYALFVSNQPGSSIKIPLGYGPAIEEGLITPNTYMEDTPLAKPDGTGVYKNSDNQYKGSVSVAQALRESRNIPAIRIFRMLGRDRANSYLQKMGMSISNKDKEASILGGLSIGFTLKDMCGSYEMVANQGIFKKPHLIDRIVDFHGNEIFNFSHDVAQVQVFSSRTTKQLIKMMQAVIYDEHGTGYEVGKNFPDYYLAGKTGTTSNDYNIWFIAFTPEITMGVWSGYPFNIPTGKSRAREGFIQFFRDIQAKRPQLSPPGSSW